MGAGVVRKVETRKALLAAVVAQHLQEATGQGQDQGKEAKRP